MTSYRQIAGPDGLLAQRKPFKGNSMSAQMEGEDYVVYSYRTEIGRTKQDGSITLDSSKYSTTTSKHQTYLRRAWVHEHTPYAERDSDGMWEPACLECPLFTRPEIAAVTRRYATYAEASAAAKDVITMLPRAES